MALSGLAVEAPEVAPLTGGLLSVANVVLSTDPHINQGVAYPAQALCAPVQIALETCWTTFDTALDVDGKVFDGFGSTHVETFAVYKGVKCWLNGDDDYTTTAANALSLGESAGVERAFQAAVLDASPTTGIVAGGTGPAAALAALEGWAVTQFGSRATLHVGRYGVTWLMAKQLLVRNLDGTLETVNGTLVANGAGYDWTNAGNHAFTTFNMWITPQVNLWGGSVVVTPAQNRTLNTQEAVAERTWSATLACPVVGKAVVTSPSA